MFNLAKTTVQLVLFGVPLLRWFCSDLGFYAKKGYAKSALDVTA